MAVFGLFSRRDKHKPPPDASSEAKASIDASVSDTQSVNADFASTSAQPSNRNGHAVYGGPSSASSSKLMLGFGARKSKASHQTDDNGYLRPPPSGLPKPRFPSSKSESGHDSLSPPPSRQRAWELPAGLGQCKSDVVGAQREETQRDVCLGASRAQKVEAISAGCFAR
ncbi:hypothetical protein EVJ58_g10560 [Rhodofomes roseus]|uniref:Uncharacterized protein n=1 Tax=Rhodofomes roseus TaxID=34475 RepID=A0A4Y9XQ19_9APHY|nr:hypothetical protein EVJ58_g10560 [Rhodofomes roseus]